MILLSHPIGNVNVRHAATALAESNQLAEFWTCVSWNPEWPLNRVLPRGLREQLARRVVPPLLRECTHHLPWREAGRILTSWLRWPFLHRHEFGPLTIDAVLRSLDRTVARRVASARNLTGVYAYEDCAARTFAAARNRGIKCIYDLPIGYWRVARAIYSEEMEREPQWACTLRARQNSPEKLARKDEELALADTVIAASTFTRETIKAAPRCTAPIHVVPYGAPPVSAEFVASPRAEKLRVLFVGSLGQRKGLSYLLRAAKVLEGRVTVTLLGRTVSNDCAPLNEALQRHRWIPSLPHAEVLREMARHDVLVLPSLFEGFGLVLLEAMAHGLPIITTPHTAGPDLIEEGKEGFIVPIRSSDAIVEKLDLLARDFRLLSAMKIAAHTTARRRSWDHYQSLLAAIVQRTTTTTTQP